LNCSGELGETEVDVEMIASDVCTGFAAGFEAGKKKISSLKVTRKKMSQDSHQAAKATALARK